MIKEKYTNFKQSKALKEIGFPQWKDCPEEYYPYVEGYDIDGNDTNVFSSNRKLKYSKVPLSLVQKWLREEKNLDVYVLPTLAYSVKCYHSFIGFEKPLGLYNSYEDALSNGIDKAIKYLIERKE